MTISVNHQITVEIEDKIITLTKFQAEQLYSALSAALNKPVYPNNNLWYNNTQTLGIRDCVAQGA